MPVKRRIADTSAFTLIELIVVISLAAIMLFFAVPRLERSFFTGDSRKLSSWLLNNVSALRSGSVEKQRILALYVEIDENKLWTGRASSVEEEKIIQKQSGGFRVPSGYRLTDVTYPGAASIKSGTARIRFYPGGYCDRAIIHVMTPEGSRISYQIQSFIPNVKIRKANVKF